ncbi:hypothetical protein [Archangium violaceum]|uniref:Uncharacterized protein n=1 Tax=Archangium violaceum Cb vi76 TaxID=1406225 RepID=A0A084SF26_9BACT|nr:hypothetical protein [Archangium violaceum]KFA87061.1 hypothetical protein Q664_50190 [Archangium violaceum Cb vi76]
MLSGLALLLWLLGCAGRDGLLVARDFPVLASAGQEAVEVDFEVVTPRHAGELRQRGVQLPRASRSGDPRAHRDFVELRVTAVGFGLTTGGYLLYCDGLPLPVLVPESLVDLELTSAEPLSDSIYPDRNEALADMAARASGSGRARYAWYRGAGGALIVPTVFSPATTPRIARTMLAVRQELVETGQRELKALLLDMTGNRILRGVFSRVVRMGSEPAVRPSVRKEGPGGEAPAPRQPVTRAAAPAAPPAPASAPGAPAPSPGLVQALTGANPTPPVAAGPRSPQDVSVNPKVPNVRRPDRPIGSSPGQNAQLQADIQYLRSIGAENIRVNQQQVAVHNSQRVGTNRPDLQFDYKGRRYHVEYDTPASGRGPGHQSRITSNDLNADVILLIVP